MYRIVATRQQLIPTWLLIAALTPNVVFGQEAEKPRYAAMGAPANPKVPAAWNKYRDHAQATQLMKQLVKAHPGYARLQSLGKSYGGRELWVMTITNQKSGKVTEKSGMWIDGGIHANEVQAVDVVLYTAWYLLEKRQENPFVRQLLNERVFYLAPMLSPDSRDSHFYKPNTTHSPRTGQRPVDNDRDGRTDEDGPDDLDKDGHITQMRIRDKNGTHKPHDDYPNLLVRVAPGERGTYRLLGTEGIDNDGDGRINEDGAGGYDPNRNWGWGWQPEYVQYGAHRYPFSIKENRVFADFIAARPHIAGAQSYHNTGGMILRGPGVSGVKYPGEDVDVYTKLGKQGEAMLPGYKSMNIAEELYQVFGGEIDWLFERQGIFAFTNELFTPFNFFRESEGGGFIASGEVMHRFNKLLLFGEGFVDWHPVEHPKYGKIEVGGMKKSWGRQPPSFLLEEECHRNMAFTLYHADQLPKIRVAEVQVKKLGDVFSDDRAPADRASNLFQVTAVIENPRVVPTHAVLDVRRKITPPNVIELSGDKVQVLVAGPLASRCFAVPVNKRRIRPSSKSAG